MMLHDAALRGDVEVITEILSSEEISVDVNDVNEAGDSALILAVHASQLHSASCVYIILFSVVSDFFLRGGGEKVFCLSKRV